LVTHLRRSLWSFISIGREHSPERVKFFQAEFTMNLHFPSHQTTGSLFEKRWTVVDPSDPRNPDG